MDPSVWADTVTHYLEEIGIVGALLPSGAADATDRYQPNRVTVTYGWEGNPDARTEVVFRIPSEDGRRPLRTTVAGVLAESRPGTEGWGAAWEEIVLSLPPGAPLDVTADFAEPNRFRLLLTIKDSGRPDGSSVRRIELMNLREQGGILFGVRIRQLDLPELREVRAFGIDEDRFYRAGGLVGFNDAAARVLEFRGAALLPEPIRRPVDGPPVADEVAAGHLSPEVAAVLARRGITSLFQFQVDAGEALDQRLSGEISRPLILTSGTAAGKTEAFLLPLLNDLIADVGHPGIQGLFVYPTKALAADQAGRFFEYLAVLNKDRTFPLSLGLMDGDTPFGRDDLAAKELAGDLRTPFSHCPEEGCNGDIRFTRKRDQTPLDVPTCETCGTQYPWLRLERQDIGARWPHLLLTNPDMLHRQLSSDWAWRNQAMFGTDVHYCAHCGTYTPATPKTLRGERDCQCGAALSDAASYCPKLVVFDEAHLLKGVFGSQVSLLIARVKKIASRHGHTPTYLGVSATIANPAEFGEQLFGEPVDLVAGAEVRSADPPTRYHLFLMPVQVTVLNAVGHVLAGCLKADADHGETNRALVFSDSKRTVYQLEASLPEFYTTLVGGILPTAVLPVTRSHTADIPPAERRRIEAAFDSHEIRVLLATQTLEVGVDFEGLGLELQTGATYSYNDYIQRVGRAGRRGHPALVICILRPQVPLDYYYYEHCRELVQFAPETLDDVPVRSDNPFLIERHTPAAVQDILLGLESGNALNWNLRGAQRAVTDQSAEIIDSLRETFITSATLEPDLVERSVQDGFHRAADVITSPVGPNTTGERLKTIIEMAIRATDVAVEVTMDNFEDHAGISVAGELADATPDDEPTAEPAELLD